MLTRKRKNNRLLPSSREEILDELAEVVIARYFPDDGKITPRFIADDYSITYSQGSYGDDFDGLLMWDGDDFHIFVNTDRQQSDYRQRFTFCHELGHFFIDGHRNALINGEVPYYSSFTGFSSEQVVEREADFFASCLLMPRSRVISFYRKFRRFSFDIIQQLSEKYGMSVVATIYRILHLDLHPIMIVKAQGGRIVSIQKSNDFYHWPIGSKKFIPEDSLMAAAVANRKQLNKTEQNWIGDWFPSGRNEAELYEHCIYYEQFDVCYSILWQD